MRHPSPISTDHHLADRAAIGDVLDDYAEAVDARDWTSLAALFADEAILDYTASGGPRGGRDEVLAWIRSALPAVLLTQHLLVNRRIRVHGDEATARTQLLNPLILGAGETPQLFLLGGHYDDRLTRTGHGWRIVERVHRVAWTAGPVPAQVPTSTNGPEG